MIEYEKIETLWDRDPEDMKHVIEGDWRLPEFLIPEKWHITEKIDGKNTRVIYQGNSDPRVQFRGRSDNAQLSAREYEWLHREFPASMFERGFDLAGPLASQFKCTVYGEFYGPKIQSGGWYRSHDYGFRVFDVRIGDWFLNWSNVEDVCNKLGLLTVPVLNRAARIESALLLVRTNSEVANIENYVERLHEGIVARTDPLLLMRDGRRLMWKLKVRDLPEY